MRRTFKALLILIGIFPIILNAQFKDITEETGIFHVYANPAFLGAGMALLDYNQDGWLDIAMAGGTLPDGLYRNNTDGTFENVSYLLSKNAEDDITSSIVSGDLDNDGCVDLVIVNYRIEGHDILLKNNCDGTFTRISSDTGLGAKGNGMGATLFDFNEDGLLDIYVMNYIEIENLVRDDDGRIIGYEHTCDKNHLYINQGNFNFSEESEAYGIGGEGCGLAVTVIPTPDTSSFGVFIANDFGPFIHPNEFLVPQFDGTYENQAARYNLEKAIYGMGIAIGDCDNDLDLDLYVSNLGENPLHVNEGSNYSEQQIELGVDNTNTPDDRLTTGWGTFFIDADNDSDQDLFVANGTVFSPEFIEGSFDDPNQLFINNDGLFVPTDASYGIVYSGPNINRGAASGDIDNDGDIDILTAYINFDPTEDKERIFRIYRNDSPQKNFVDVKLESTFGASDAYGSLVYVYSGDVARMQYKYSSGTHASDNSDLIHFGLDTLSHIDSLVVIWPNKLRTAHFNLPINEIIKVSDDNASFDILGCMDENNDRYNSLATINYGCKKDFSTSTIDLSGNEQNIDIGSDGKHLFISMKEKHNLDYQLFDISGKSISRRTRLPNNLSFHDIDLSEMNSGVYIVKIRSTTFTITRPIAIIKE